MLVPNEAWTSRAPWWQRSSRFHVKTDRTTCRDKEGHLLSGLRRSFPMDLSNLITWMWVSGTFPTGWEWLLLAYTDEDPLCESRNSLEWSLWLRGGRVTMEPSKRSGRKVKIRNGLGTNRVYSTALLHLSLKSHGLPRLEFPRWKLISSLSLASTPPDF